MRKEKIVIVGAGKLAYSLTSALLNANYSIVSVISQKLRSAKSLAQKFSIEHYSNKIQNIPEDVNVFFITVPDGEIKKVANKLSKFKRNFNESFNIIIKNA